jgi:MFS transporter, DHA1 family, tetracycline resistance protein
VQGFLGRRLIPRFGQRRIIQFGLISALAGYSVYTFADDGWVVYLGILVSACQGLVFPCLQGLMSAEMPPSEQGELQGAVASIQSLSAIVGPPLMTTTFAWFSGGGAPIYAPGAPFALSLLFVGLTAVMFFRAMGSRQAVPA